VGLSHVFLAVAQIGEIFGTKFTHMGLFSGVNVEVVEVLLLANESLVAKLALELHLGKRGVVLLNVVSVCRQVELFPAFFAGHDGVLVPEMLGVNVLVFESGRTLAALDVLVAVHGLHVTTVTGLGQ